MNGIVNILMASIWMYILMNNNYDTFRQKKNEQINKWY